MVESAEPEPRGRLRHGGKGGHRRLTRAFYVREDWWRRARNAVAHTRLIPGEAGSLSHLVERALHAETTRLEQRYNDGKPFPNAKLPRGPGIGTATPDDEVDDRGGDVE